MNITATVDGADADALAYAALLCTQLPRDSRLARAVNPQIAWSDGEYILRRIEYLLRSIFWDGKGQKPEPIPAPGDIEGAQAAKEKEDEAQLTVAAVLGMGAKHG